MAQLRAKVTNLTEAIADGILRHSPSMAASLGAYETELAGAEQELVVDSVAAEKVVEMVPRVAEQYRRMVEELPLVLRGSVREARREIGALLGGEVTMTPDETGAHLVAHPALNRQALTLRCLWTQRDTRAGSGGRIARLSANR